MTNVSPSDEGAERWREFLLQIACSEEAIAEFLQQVAGMAAIGKVYEERLIIAVGNGGNGKSTFFNAIRDVLGDYAETIRSEDARFTVLWTIILIFCAPITCPILLSAADTV